MLSEDQLEKPASNIDIDDYLEDVRTAADALVGRDTTTDVPDEILLALLVDETEVNSPHETARRVIEQAAAQVDRIIAVRPASGDERERSNPHKLDAVGWARHRARQQQLADRMAEIRATASSLVESAGGPRSR